MTVALAGIIGVLLGALLGNRFAWDRDDRIRRANFYSRLSELRALVNKIDDHHFPAWFSKCQVEVERECALVHTAIFWWHRQRFNAARMKCAAPRCQSDIADPIVRLGTPDPLYGHVEREETTYQAGRLHMKGVLDDLIACAG
jgi:hypothetical protein